METRRLEDQVVPNGRTNLPIISGVHLINHIDEGLWILSQFQASDLAKRAFTIHPLLQIGEINFKILIC